MSALKLCVRCETWKPRSEFPRHKGYRDGFATYCKTCANQLTQEAYRRNKARICEKRRARYAQERGRQLPLLTESKPGKCTCHQYSKCMRCRNAERERAFAAGEIPCYLLGAVNELMRGVQQ